MSVCIPSPGSHLRDSWSFWPVFTRRVFLTESVRKPGQRLPASLRRRESCCLSLEPFTEQHAPWPFWGGLLYVPGSALIIFGLALSRGRGFLAAHLGSPWIRQLGIASFSFYMIHVPLLRTVRGLCYHLGWGGPFLDCLLGL